MSEQAPAPESAPAPTDPYLMSSDQVTAKLKSLTAEYERSKRSDDPHSKLRDRYDGHKARFDKLMENSPKERGKFDELMQAKLDADPVALGMSGSIGDVPSSDMRQIAVGADWLRELGLPEQAIHDYISGAPVEQEFYYQVEAWKMRSLKDSAFVKSYLDGDSDAVRRMTIANAVLLCPIKENAA